MEPCFEKVRLVILLDESRKMYPGEMVLTPEQIETLTPIPCPFCRQKTLRYIGNIGEMASAVYRCSACSFMAELDDLTQKDRIEAINEFFEKLKWTYKKVRKELDAIMNSYMQYRP